MGNKPQSQDIEHKGPRYNPLDSRNHPHGGRSPEAIPEERDRDVEIGSDPSNEARSETPGRPPRVRHR